MDWNEIKRKSLLGLLAGAVVIWFPIVFGLNIIENASIDAINNEQLFLFYPLVILSTAVSGVIYRSRWIFVRGLFLGFLNVGLNYLLFFTNGPSGSYGLFLDFIIMVLGILIIIILPGAIIGLSVPWEGDKLKLLYTSLGGFIGFMIMEFFLFNIGSLTKSDFVFKSFILTAPYLLFGTFVWFFIGLFEEIYKTRPLA